MAKKIGPGDLFRAILGAHPVSLARIKIDLDHGDTWPLEQQHKNVKMLLNIAFRLDIETVPSARREHVTELIDSIKRLAMEYDDSLKPERKGNGGPLRARAGMIKYLSEKYVEIRGTGRRLFEEISPDDLNDFDICFGTT